jgi:AraC-like DNA-binding protein
MPTITIPRYFENVCHANLVHLDTFSSVLYNQSVDQEQVAVCITKSMFAIILKGKKNIHTEQGDIEIASGDMFFAQRGTYLLSERMNVDGEYRSLIFFMDDKYLQSFVSRNPDLIGMSKNIMPNGGIYKITSYPLINTWAESVLPVFLSDYTNRKELLKVKTEELLQLLINTDEKQHLIDFLHTFLHPEKLDLKRYMEENFILPLTIDDFAKQTGRSLTSFKNDFKEIFSLPPKQWINTRRLDRAHNLIANSNCTVTEVCYDVGFQNISHFIQLFSKRFGVTPKKLQQDSRGKFIN